MREKVRQRKNMSQSRTLVNKAMILAAQSNQMISCLYK